MYNKLYYIILTCKAANNVITIAINTKTVATTLVGANIFLN